MSLLINLSGMNLIWNRHTRNLMLRLVQLLPIRRGRVMCVCWGGEKYNCNPKAITDKMLEMGHLSSDGLFNVTYAFCNPKEYLQDVPSEIASVEIGTLRYYYLLATSRFIISNTRLGGGLWWPFNKRKGQRYIFTGHGGNGIKKIEFDADSLSKKYLEIAEKDTSRIDLFLSGSSFRSKVIRSAYRYEKEILEEGTPRNDMLIKNGELHTSGSKNYLIYTPTFRNNGRRDVYGFDIDRVVDALEKRFGGEWYIRISSHPNMRFYYRKIYDFSHPRMIDVGEEELQPLLETSDALITDYSSAEMDFAILRRPIFQLCRDKSDYDRGFYIEPEKLPFPYAENDDELVRNIMEFDNKKYLSELEAFNNNVIGLKETGHAAEAVVNWMIQHR